MANSNEFQRKVEKVISALKINKPKEKESKTKEEFEKEKEKYKKLTEKLEEFKKKLKEIMPKYTEDERITSQEEEEIFKSMPKDLLKELDIKDPLELMAQVGIYFISEQKKFRDAEIMLNTRPADLFDKENILKFKDAPWALEILLQALFKNPKVCSQLVFENLKLFIDKPWAIHIIRFAMPSYPQGVIRNYKLIEHLSGSEEILKTAAILLTPRALFFLINNFKHATFALEVLKDMIWKNKKYSFLVFLYFDAYKEMPWAKEILKLAIAVVPFDAFVTYFYHFIIYNKELPYIKEIVKYLLDFRAYDCIREFLKIKKYVHIVKDEEVLKIFLEKKSEYFSFAEHIEQYKNESWAYELLSVIASEAPIVLMRNISKFKEMSWAKEIVSIIAKKYPECVFFYFEGCYETTWIKDVLITAIETNPSLANKYYQIYKDLSCAKEIIETVYSLIDKNDLIFLYDEYPELVPKDQQEILNMIDFFPEKAFILLDIYKGKTYAKNILIRIVTEKPMLAFKYFYSYRNLSWAKEVLNVAITNLDGKTINDDLSIFKVRTCLYLLDKNSKNELTILFDRKRKEYNEFIETVLKANINITKATNEKSIKVTDIKKNFWKDASTQNVLKISLTWLNTEKNLDNEQKDDLRLMICRNLYFQNKGINFINVVNEIKRIKEQREKYKDTAIFKNRNVVLLAHNELSKVRKFDEKYYGKYRFGHKTLMGFIKEQHGNVELFRSQFESHSEFEFKPKSTIEKFLVGPGVQVIKTFFDLRIDEIKKEKKSVLSAIVNTKPPLTVFFDSHGAPNGIYFSNESQVHISQSELVNALKTRNNKYPDEPTPILIFANCYASTFLRGVYDKLGSSPKPISIGASEYGQLSYTGTIDNITYIDNKKETVTLGRVVNRSIHMESLNSVVYLPSNNGKIMQVAEKDKKAGKVGRRGEKAVSGMKEGKAA